ncbi:MAG TPA: hypothetical protein VJ794_09500, partial [Gemmatimonadales bacterium]|nr:hypothetical protein [Gemmatimonadales bacterium]
MRRIPHRALIGWSTLVGATAAALLAAALLLDRLASDVLFTAVGSAVFTIMGALIEDRRPGNAVGRINLATGLALVLSGALRLMAELIDRGPGALPPAAAAMAVVASVAFAIALVGGSLGLVARYPDGRLPGLAGRLLDWLIAAAIFAAATQLFRPGPLEHGWVEAVANPMGVEALRPVFDAAAAMLLLLFAVGMVLGIIGLFNRYRSSDARVRAQLRWFLAACAIPLSLIVPLFASTGAFNEWVWNLWLLSFLLIPLAVGIGVLRYHLYEIDRIVSRTMGYAALTAVLAGVFVAVNLVLGSLVASMTGGSTAAVAASTLAAAALFQPLKHAIQAPIDRRFNRA